MTLPAAVPLMRLARSQSALLPRRTIPTNTSSKAKARPAVLAATISTAVSSSTTASSTSTTVVESVIPVVEFKADSSTSAVVAAVVNPTTPTSVIESTLTSTITNLSTEPSTFTPSIQPSTSVSSLISAQPIIESQPLLSSITTILPFSSTSISLSTAQTTMPSSSYPFPLAETSGDIVASASLVTSSTIFQNSPSTNIAGSTIAVTMQTSQSVQLSSVPASTTTTVFPTKAAGEDPAQSSASGGLTLNTTPVKDVAPVMGGIIGGVAFVGILLFLWWRMHRKKLSRQNVLTPTAAHFHRRNHSDKYEIDGESLGPTPRSARWKAQTTGLFSRLQKKCVAVISSIQAKSVSHNDAPGVNLNRGNSQFFEPVSQHSHTNSTVSQVQKNTYPSQGLFGNHFNWFKDKDSGDLMDPYADTRRINEKDTCSSQTSPQFSQLSPSRDLNLSGTGQSRRSLSLGTFPTPILPKSSFSGQSTVPILSRSPEVVTLNPFADPTDPTSPFTSRPNTSKSVANSQHTRSQAQPPMIGLASRGQHMSTTSLKTTPNLRYPMPIHTNLINNSDMIVSPISASDREIKGRSDPFDLERPDLWQSPYENFTHGQNEDVPISPFSTRGIAQGVQMKPRTEAIQLNKHQRMVSDAPTYGSSKYSSGFSFLDQFGDSAARVEPLLWNKASPQGDKVMPDESNGKTRANVKDTVGMAL